LAGKERKLLKYLASAICFVLGVLLIVDAQRSDSVDQANSGPAQVSPSVKEEPKSSTSFWSSEPVKVQSGLLCSTLLETCTAKIAFIAEDCNEKASRIEVNQFLDKPLKNIHCQDIYERIDKACPPGCRVDASRSIVLPADVQFFFDDESSEVSGCRVTGERLVNIKGQCVTKGS